MSPLRDAVARREQKSKDKRPKWDLFDTHDPCVSTAIVDVMSWPSAGATRDRAASTELGGESNSFGGQASKGIRWMPWLQEAMKDVVKLR